MPPAKKRKTATKAGAKKKDHIVTAMAFTEQETSKPAEPAEPAAPVEPAEPADPKPTLAESLEEQAVSTAYPTSDSGEAPRSPLSGQPSERDAKKEPSPSSFGDAAVVAPTPSTTIRDRMERFRALQTRAKSSSASNLTAAQTEAHRIANDPSQLASVQRKSAVASHKLLKADIEDSGGDFERKRAWDWTVDESEKWDERQRQKEAHRDDNAFSDYRREANKVYQRQLKNLGDPDLEKYTKDKLRAIEAAAARGSLEIVETADGEMVAVDKDGTFYGGGGGSGDMISSFADNKPDKKAVDRLVGEMKKAEEVAARKRKERAARNGDDADVTYINDKNKQFNQKLSRFYNKYTAEIRDSFERGTMI